MLTEAECAHLAAEAGCDLRTARRVAQGQEVRGVRLRERIETAAKRLKLKLPTIKK